MILKTLLNISPQKSRREWHILIQYSPTGPNDYPGYSNDYLTTLYNLWSDEILAYTKRPTDTTGSYIVNFDAYIIALG